jgi:hypothetical protein
MNRRKLITLALAGFAVAGGALAAASFAGAKSKDAKCYQTPDGKYVCKSTGQVMDSPCCQKPDSK